MSSADTKIVAEARERAWPKWFDYIHVRERIIIGSKQPPDYVIGFGPRCILSPDKTEARAERTLDSVKQWLWQWIERDRFNRSTPAEAGQWVSVSERLPERGAGYMLVYLPENDGDLDSKITAAVWDGENWQGPLDEYNPEMVTHWRELPTPPSTEKGEE